MHEPYDSLTAPDARHRRDARRWSRPTGYTAAMARRQYTARQAAVEVIRKLREAGHVAYLAGGCVRDELLGMEPKDYDVATEATPQTVRGLFPRSRYVGEAFGVCLVFVGSHAIEVATFRSEWGYHDGRRPDHVIFTDARHDAERRDFTINGLFEEPREVMDPQLETPPTEAAPPPGIRGRIVDYVGGVADLEAGVVRAIGDPDERFAEDYLRMLRAVRFAARLGFEIEATTAAAIRATARYLGQISRERIGGEVRVMLAGDAADPPVAVALMQQLRLDGPVLNEDHRDAPPQLLGRLSTPIALPTALAAWMLDRHLAPQQLQPVVDFAHNQANGVIRKWRSALSLSNIERDHLRGTLALLTGAADWPTLDVAKRKRLLAQPLWLQSAQLLEAIDPATAQKIEREAAPLLAQGVAPTPLIGGNDLIAMGYAPGPQFGPLLEQVYDAQLAGDITTMQQARAWVQQRAGDAGLRRDAASDRIE